MKKLFILSLILMLPLLSFAQFKEQAKTPAFSQVLAKPAGNVILGFLNSDKIDMHHTFSMSYMGMGNGGMMVNSYMNTIDYRISQPLMLRMNLGIMNSPYNSFKNSALNNLNNTQFFGGAELYYRPSEKSLIKVGVNVGPGYYNPGYYNNDWYGW